MVIDVGGGGQYRHPLTSTSSGDLNPTMRLGRIHTLWQFRRWTEEQINGLLGLLQEHAGYLYATDTPWRSPSTC
jgi:hypothetical protein